MQNRPFIFKILYLDRVPAAGANLFEFDPCPRQIQRLSFSLAPTLHLFPFFSSPLFHSAFDFTTINNTSNFLLLIPLRLADQSLRPKESIPADVFLELWVNFCLYHIDPRDNSIEKKKKTVEQYNQSSDTFPFLLTKLSLLIFNLQIITNWITLNISLKNSDVSLPCKKYRISLKFTENSISINLKIFKPTTH